ncbi:glycosyltransferase [Leeuwenhoekiella sp. NPDC079379]|uniref:glycosyltransferase n=1 Tax=Leeuwenhoekiella sp. NPDC079379 TaxID=3364122 RepID=UPI0037CADE54
MYKNATVSVVMITYKHGDFIEQAINSILMQQCSYPIELIIADDNPPNSPDKTTDIIKNITSNHKNGNWINYTKHAQNKGMMGNFLWALNSAKGKYIAICEGDDYWTDPLKIQRQVDFLERNNDYAICFHAVNIEYENNIIPFLNDTNKNTKDTTSLIDIIKSNYIHTMSVIFRNYNDYPEWLINAYPGDWPLHIINATHGNIKFLPEQMATYRVHFGGVHSTTGGKPVEQIQTLQNISIELNSRGFPEYSKIINFYNDKAEINYFVFNKNIKDLNRWEKSSLLLKSQHKKFNYLFFIPILLNNSSYRIFNIYMSLKFYFDLIR